MLLDLEGLRLQQIDNLSPRDDDFLWLMKEYAPNCDLKHGDICYLSKATRHLIFDRTSRDVGIPRFWKVQFVISAYQFELHNAMQITNFGGDQAVNYLDSAGFNFAEATTPIVYAHGFPHGDNPNTAAWFPRGALKRLCLRTEDVDWVPVLDEFKTSFHGYDLPSGFALDMAPDLYSKGLNLRRPLWHEEDTFELAAQMGMEARMMTKEDPRNIDPYLLDPEDDIFTRPWDNTDDA